MDYLCVLNIIARVLIRGGMRVRVRDGDVTVEAKVGMMQPQAKECKQTLEAQKVRREFPQSLQKECNSLTPPF